MGRSPCCEKVGLKKGPWTPEEDQKLLAFIEQHGHGSWRALPSKAGLQRCGKSCRLRWTNYLRPDIKRGKFSLQEEQTIIQLHALLGNRWSAIATHLPKRTDNEIKNYWNTHLKKRLTKMGIDPVTHKPCSGSLCATTGLSHMAQWESARLEAEARLVRESKLLSSVANNNSSNNNSDNNNISININKNPPLSSRPPCLDVLKAWQAQLGGLSSTSSCTSGAMKEASTLSTIMPLTGTGSGDHLESPTSTLSFPPGGMFPTMTTTMIENAMMLQEAKENCGIRNIPILPLNDMSFYNESGTAWFCPTSTAGHDDVNHVEGFADLLVGEYDNCRVNNSTNVVGENYVAGAGNHGLDQENNKNYWSNILMNLVTTSSSTSPPATGSSPSHAVF